MKIISCHIENFGKLHDYSINFSEGVNIICKENGWGKSTLAAFIRIMFYGLKGIGSDVEKSERSRYKPWQDGKFGGQLVFELNGIQYQVIRTFKNKPSEDKFEIRNVQTNKLYNYDGKTPNCLGERLFKVDRESFMRTIFIGQDDRPTSSTDNINAKISNLMDLTNDINNFETACDNITKAINKLKWYRTSLIPKINRLNRWIQDNRNIQYLIEECQNQLNISEKRYGELKEKIQQDRIMPKSAPIPVKQSNDISKLTKIGTIIAIICIISTVFVTGLIAKSIFGGSAIFIIVALLIKNDKIEPVENDANEISSPITNISQLTDELELLKENINDYSNKLKSLQSRYNDIEDNKKQLAELKMKQAEALKKYKYLIKTREKLIIAKDTITSKYREPLLKSFYYYYKLLNDRDTDIFNIDSNFSATRNEFGKERNINTQSSGYKDLIWICLRIALVEAMYREDKPLLIMDDPFINLDDKKVIAGMKLLEQVAKSYQIIYFTCSNSRK